MNKIKRTEWAQAELNAEGKIVELRARIRELEAELAACRSRFLDVNAAGWKARAEKAEARVAELVNRVYQVAKVLATAPETKHFAEELWFAIEKDIPDVYSPEEWREFWAREREEC